MHHAIAAATAMARDVSAGATLTAQSTGASTATTPTMIAGAGIVLDAAVWNNRAGMRSLCSMRSSGASSDALTA